MTMAATFAILFAAHQPANPPTSPSAGAPTVQRREEFHSTPVPQALFRHVFPYSRCLAASRGRTMHSDGRPLPPLPGVTLGYDCGEYRRRAVEAGHHALRQQMPDERERSDVIQRVLRAIEGSFGTSGQ